MGQPTIWPSGGPIGAVLFGILLVAAWVAFAVRIRKLVRLMSLGRSENRFDHIGERIKYFTLMVLGQRGVLRDPLPGIAHFFTFWGFIIIQLDALNLWAMGFNFTLPVISSRAFAVLLDVSIILAFLALIEFTYRRLVLRPKQLESQGHGMADAFIIIGMIALVLLTVFFYEVFAYAATRGADWTLFGATVGQAWIDMPARTASALMSIFWWANAIVVLSFLIYIPNSKHLHLMATPFNVFFHNLRPKGALDPIPDLEEREDYGVHAINQFT
ncbi:MAG: hypothetical protein ACXWQZ_20440, partial [Ktedonobacterales bacterium]